MSAHRLHRVECPDSRIFCGPYALAALTGLPVSTWPNEPMRWSRTLDYLSVALTDRAGVRSVETPSRRGRPVYEGTWAERPGRVCGRPMLWQVCRPGRLGIASVRVGHGGHLVAIDGFLASDNHTRRPVWVHDHPWGRQRVRLLAELEPGESGLDLESYGMALASAVGR